MKNNFCIIRIYANFESTIIVATDTFNNELAWEYISRNALYNYSKTSNYNKIATKLKELGINSVDIFVKGPGLGKEPAINAFIDNGIIIHNLKDTTPVPHNGIVPIKRIRKKLS